MLCYLFGYNCKGPTRTGNITLLFGANAGIWLPKRFWSRDYHLQKRWQQMQIPHFGGRAPTHHWYAQSPITRNLPSPSWILLLQRQFEYSLRAEGVMMLCRSVTCKTPYLLTWSAVTRALSNQSIEYLQGQRDTSLDSHSAVRAVSWAVCLHLNTPDPWQQTGQPISPSTSSAPWNVWQSI